MADTIPSANKDFQDFVERHVKPLAKELEKKRQSYLKKFVIHCVFSTVLFALLLIYGGYFQEKIRGIISWLDRVFGSDNSAIEPFLTSGLLYVVFPLCLMGFAILPIYRYRKHVRTIKVNDVVVGGEVTRLKEQSFEALFRYFGDLSLRSEHNVSMLNLHGNRILPDYEHMYSEDRITGTVLDSRLEIAEAKLITDHQGRKVAVFSGLLVIIDVCNPDVKLRGDFQGETVLIQDGRKHAGYIEEKYKGFEKVALPTRELESRFEVLSTAPEEASRLLNEGFIREIETLSDIIAGAREQMTHSDATAIALTAARIRYLGGVLFSWLAAIPLTLGYNLYHHKLDVTRYRILRYRNAESYDPLKHTAVYQSVGAVSAEELEHLNEGVECNFYKDKILLTIPYVHDLFEPNSLFEPALIEEDTELVYHIMQAVKTVTEKVVAAK